MGGGPHPRRGLHPARQPRVPHRAGRPGQGPRASSSTAQSGTGPRSRRSRSRRSATRTSCIARPAGTPTGSGTASRRSCPAGSARSSARRYSRHVLIPEVGEEGQLKLLDARILLIGAGGLGSPASLYLAAAGVGTLGIVDDDVVDATNLQRQIVHSTERLGEPKAESAKRTIEALNPDVDREDLPGAPHLRERRPDPRRGLGRDRRRRRQLPNPLPAQRRLGLARDPGRARLDLPLRGPGDRLQAARGPVLPLPVPAAAAARARPELRRGRRARRAARASSARSRRTRRSSSRSGSASRSSGRLLLFDALAAAFTEVSLRRDPACPVCGDNPTITEYVDYVEFCQGTRAHA